MFRISQNCFHIHSHCYFACSFLLSAVALIYPNPSSSHLVSNYRINISLRRFHTVTESNLCSSTDWILFLMTILALSPAPCVPQNVHNNLDCQSDVLNITWQSVGHVVQFFTSVASSTGHNSSCESDEHHCTVHKMQCGSNYSVTVLAQDEACNSSKSTIERVTTGEVKIHL